MFQKAMSDAGVTDKEKCLFVDDSYGISHLTFTDIVNVAGAKEFGWKEVCHLLFAEDTVPPAEVGIRQIRDLEELREIYPHVFQK
jgi:pyrimidine and pyridine-specific 5'-nucleotidase